MDPAVGAIDPAEVAQGILARERLMQVATVGSDAMPWLFTCWYAFEELDLFFMSKDVRRHSQNILATGRVCATVVSLANTLGDPVQSLTIEGTCARITEDLVVVALGLLTERYPRISLSPDELLDPNVPDFLWRVAPTGVVLFDELNFGSPGNPRVEMM